MACQLLLNTFFKEQELNKCQTQYLQEIIDTPILTVYQPGKQASVPDVVSHSPILHDSMDERADSQFSGVGQKPLYTFFMKQHIYIDQHI